MIKLKLSWLDLVGGSQDSHLRAGSHISFKSHVKSLGVYTDTTLSMARHTDHISCSAYLEIKKISSVRHLLTRQATVQLMCSFVLSRLDYWNSLLIDITSDQMYRLQKIPNHAAKVVFRKSKHEHVTPLLKKLHWLLVKERILFKIANFAFRFFDGTLPPYLSSCLSVYTPSRTLRSSSDEEKNSFQCKMETQGLWSPVDLCSGAPCLKQSSSPHPTQLLPLTVQNFR